MKIYFAGPLFTPYVRQFISDHASLLRDNGIEVFVPHETFNSMVSEAKVESLISQGLINRSELGDGFTAEAVMNLVRAGRLTREQVGLPTFTPANVFDTDYEGLSSANAVLALLDGTQVDDGTACEIGIFYGLMKSNPTKKGIVGYITDSRGARKKDHGFGQNLFVLGILEEVGKVCLDFADVIELLKSWDSELRAG